MLPASSSPYGRWCAWLVEFATGSDEPPEGLPAIDPATLGGTVSARLMTRSADAFQARLNLWLAAFQRDRASATTPQAFAQAVRAARHRLTPIRAFVSCELFPDDLRRTLEQGLADNLASFQEALEEGARRNPFEGEHLLRVVRETQLDRSLALDLEGGDDVATAPPGTRPILFGPRYA